MGGLTMKHPFDYRGKSVFIAGGSSGINLGIAHAFAAAGAKVAIASRSQNRIDNVVVELQAHGDEVAGYWADVRDYAAFAAVLEQAHQRFGDFDVLISAAAGNFVAPALGMSSNGFKAVMDIDLLGTYNVLRAAHPYLKKPGAAIINISAPQAFQPMAYQVHVGAAKAGVDMERGCWPSNGRRMASASTRLHRGAVEGMEGMARLAPTDEARQAVTHSIPLKRWAKKENIANMAMFLCSPLASYVTGIFVPVDGGRTLLGGRGLSSAME